MPHDRTMNIVSSGLARCCCTECAAASFGAGPAPARNRSALPATTETVIASAARELLRNIINVVAARSHCSRNSGGDFFHYNRRGGFLAHANECAVNGRLKLGCEQPDIGQEKLAVDRAPYGQTTNGAPVARLHRHTQLPAALG